VRGYSINLDRKRDSVCADATSKMSFQIGPLGPYRGGTELNPPFCACRPIFAIVQGHLGLSDADAVEATVLDLRWQLVLDRLGEIEPAFSQGAPRDTANGSSRTNSSVGTPSFVKSSGSSEMRGWLSSGEASSYASNGPKNTGQVNHGKRRALSIENMRCSMICDDQRRLPEYIVIKLGRI
jgi:hypothetical protein